MNIPFLCVFLMFALNYFTKLPVAKAMAQEPGGYDNHYPRDQEARLTGWGKRAVSAHLNGFEIFSGFAAAVIMAHISGANEVYVSILSVIFLVSRVFYIALYLANRGTLRSLVWTVGWVCVISIFIMALIKG